MSGSNRRPPACKAGALANWANAPSTKILSVSYESTDEPWVTFRDPVTTSLKTSFQEKVTLRTAAGSSHPCLQSRCSSQLSYVPSSKVTLDLTTILQSSGKIIRAIFVTSPLNWTPLITAWFNRRIADYNCTTYPSASQRPLYQNNRGGGKPHAIEIHECTQYSQWSGSHKYYFLFSRGCHHRSHHDQVRWQNSWMDGFYSGKLDHTRHQQPLYLQNTRWHSDSLLYCDPIFIMTDTKNSPSRGCFLSQFGNASQILTSQHFFWTWSRLR